MTGFTEMHYSHIRFKYPEADEIKQTQREKKVQANELVYNILL